MKQFYNIHGIKHTVIGELIGDGGDTVLVYATFSYKRGWKPGAEFKERITEGLGKYYFKTRKAYRKWKFSDSY